MRDVMILISIHYEIRCLLFFFFFTYYLFLLHCWARAFSSCGEHGLLFVAVRGLLIVVASLVVEHGL